MNARIEAATKAGMRHYGYTDEQIEAAEQPVIHGEECEFYAGVGWSCIHESGRPIHAESVELSQEFEMAEVHIAAADAVMFSDEAIERASRAAYEAQMEDGDTPWDHFGGSHYLDHWRDQTRTVIAALRGYETN